MRRALVNASGAWVNEVLQRIGVEPRQRLRLVQGSHLVLRRLYEGEHAYLLQSPDRRVVFAIPFEHDYTLVGTTDVPFDGRSRRTSGSRRRSGDYLLECLARFLREPVGDGDIRRHLRRRAPAVSTMAARPGAEGLARLPPGAAAWPPARRCSSVYGGKITTYRRLAEAGARALVPALGPAGRPAWTDREPLPGGDVPDGDLRRVHRARAGALAAAACVRCVDAPGPPLRHAHVALLLGERATAGGPGPALRRRPHRSRSALPGATPNGRAAPKTSCGGARVSGCALPASAVHDLQDAVAQLL